MLDHGGKLDAAAKQYGIALADWLDLSTGINPHGYPVPLIPADLWQRLPLEDDGLLQAAASYYGTQSLLATAGSQAALQALPRLRAPAKVAMLSPMYQEHSHAWQQHGHNIVKFKQLDHLLNPALNSAPDVVVLCNPNNPTAALFALEDLLAIHAQLAQRGGWLIVDEAYIDTNPQHSLAPYTQQKGLIVLRSLGKFFGLAGARVGFVLADAAILAGLAELLGPWALTGASRYIAKQALADTAWQQQTRAFLLAQSAKLATLLSAHGFAPEAGCAMFQYLQTPQAQALQIALAQQGIWTRYFAASNSLRFGLPPESGWQRLAQALSQISQAALQHINDSQNSL